MMSINLLFVVNGENSIRAMYKHIWFICIVSFDQSVTSRFICQC